MGKYKIGDKIKCIKVFANTDFENFTLDKIYTIHNVIPMTDDKYEIIDDKGNIISFFETSRLECEGFEPYIEEEMNFLDILKGY